MEGINLLSVFWHKLNSGKARKPDLGAYSAKLLAETCQGDIALKVSNTGNRTMVVVTLPSH